MLKLLLTLLVLARREPPQQQQQQQQLVDWDARRLRIELAVDSNDTDNSTTKTATLGAGAHSQPQATLPWLALVSTQLSCQINLANHRFDHDDDALNLFAHLLKWHHSLYISDPHT